jgi:plastocyanin
VSIRPGAGFARIAIVAALAALVALCAFASVASAATVYMKADKKGLRFEAPKTVVNGEALEIVNRSNPKKVGPHTFSLVTKASLPKTPKAHQLCFTPKHICKAIATWHGVKGNGPVKINPAEVSKKGDSWFTGEKAGTSFEQPVNVDTTAGASRIYFICAIHSGMQGSINVLPGG